MRGPLKAVVVETPRGAQLHPSVYAQWSPGPSAFPVLFVFFPESHFCRLMLRFLLWFSSAIVVGDGRVYEGGTRR